MKSSLINFFSQKIVIGTLSFLLGVGCFWGFGKLQSYQANNKTISTLSSQSEDPFADLWQAMDPFKSQSKMFKDMDMWRDQMMKDFHNFESRSESFWPSWATQRESSFALKKREDSDAIYYDFETGNKMPKNFEVKVENNQLTITGLIEDGDGKTMTTTSSFMKSFPLPENVDPENYGVKNESGKIVIRLIKTKNDQVKGTSAAANSNI